MSPENKERPPKMIVYFSHPGREGYPYREAYERIRQDRNLFDFDFIFPHNTDEYIDVKKVFPKCCLVVADITDGGSICQGVELQIAKDMGLPIVTIRKSETSTSKTAEMMADVSLEYDDIYNISTPISYVAEKYNNECLNTND